MKETVSATVSWKNSKNRKIYKNQECWKEFTNRCKTGQYILGDSQCHSARHNLRFYKQE